jgi:hypothetical protein
MEFSERLRERKFEAAAQELRESYMSRISRGDMRAASAT